MDSCKVRRQQVVSLTGGIVGGGETARNISATARRFPMHGETAKCFSYLPGHGGGGNKLQQ